GLRADLPGRRPDSNRQRGRQNPQKDRRPAQTRAPSPDPRRGSLTRVFAMPKIAIVGAGISGLSLAYRLHQFVPVAEVTVLEKRDRPGGTVWTERRDGFQVEVGPNGFLDNKPSTLALCRELGLGDRLVPASEAAARNRYLFLDGKLQLLPNSLPSFLRSGLLSWRGKLVVLSEPLRRRRRDQSDESIDAFVRRR